MYDWAFCKSCQNLESVMLVWRASLNIGAATTASKPPAHRAGTTEKYRPFLEVTDRYVNSSVKSSGASSKAKSTLLEVSDVILVWPIRCWMSLPDRVIAAKPPQRAK